MNRKTQEQAQANTRQILSEIDESMAGVNSS